jgi:hypothetical protein
MRVRSAARRSLPLLVVAMAFATAASAPIGQEKGKKPSISVRANPPVGFSPLRVVLTAEVKGGSNDYEDFYCASVEWDWDDDTKSQSNTDCDPYEAGKSEIKRRYIGEHTFRVFSNDLSATPAPPAQFRVKFHLKQKNKIVGTGQATIEVRQGAGG